jgi:hypothetical protein
VPRDFRLHSFCPDRARLVGRPEEARTRGRSGIHLKSRTGWQHFAGIPVEAQLSGNAAPSANAALSATAASQMQAAATLSGKVALAARLMATTFARGTVGASAALSAIAQASSSARHHRRQRSHGAIFAHPTRRFVDLFLVDDDLVFARLRLADFGLRNFSAALRVPLRLEAFAKLVLSRVAISGWGASVAEPAILAANVRFAAHYGLKADIGPCLKSANAQSRCDRDRGEPRGSAPPTPPCVRVRTRRFEKLR